ncbi:MAG: DUF3592 domain-containing protein [Bacillota bacterium]
MARHSAVIKTSGAVVAIIFALAMYGAGVFALIDRMNFYYNSTVATGKVVDANKKSTSKTDRTFIYTTKRYDVSVISYKDSKKKEHRIEETGFFSKAPFAIGATVKVRVDKKDADIGVVDNFVNLFGYIVMFFLIGTVFLLVFIFVLKSKYKDKGKFQLQ